MWPTDFSTFTSFSTVVQVVGLSGLNYQWVNQFNSSLCLWMQSTPWWTDSFVIHSWVRSQLVSNKPPAYGALHQRRYRYKFNPKFVTMCGGGLKCRHIRSRIGANKAFKNVAKMAEEKHKLHDKYLRKHPGWCYYQKVCWGLQKLGGWRTGTGANKGMLWYNQHVCNIKQGWVFIASYHSDEISVIRPSLRLYYPRLNIIFLLAEWCTR